jgi:hypothetical protein
MERQCTSAIFGRCVAGRIILRAHEAISYDAHVQSSVDEVCDTLQHLDCLPSEALTPFSRIHCLQLLLPCSQVALAHMYEEHVQDTSAGFATTYIVAMLVGVVVFVLSLAMVKLALSTKRKRQRFLHVLLTPIAFADKSDVTEDDEHRTKDNALTIMSRR